MNREPHRANPHWKINAAAVLFNRVKDYLRNEGKIEPDAVRAMVTTSDRREKKDWLKSFGNIKIVHEFIRLYDLTVYEMKFSLNHNRHAIEICLHTKNFDEGFYGSQICLRYEQERIREERKVEEMRKMIKKL